MKSRAMLTPIDWFIGHTIVNINNYCKILSHIYVSETRLNCRRPKDPATLELGSASTRPASDPSDHPLARAINNQVHWIRLWCTITINPCVLTTQLPFPLLPLITFIELCKDSTPIKCPYVRKSTSVTSSHVHYDFYFVFVLLPVASTLC